MSQIPELLAPAGSLEKLKVASLYGADAVYLGGQKFGLRAASENFTFSELIEGVEFAHSNGTLVYVVLNGFLHDQDIEDLGEFVSFLEEINVDAVICSDLGVVEFVSQNSNLIIHLSTQASCLNSYSGKLWKKMGVKRLILGRECSIEDGAKIKKETGLEVEMFIHGAMCMAYSGNCVISNYTAGRDSNRGGCAHSCRFEYSLDVSKYDTNSSEGKKSFFMSSKDLNGLALLEDFCDAGIDSIKVEGRMKGNIYAGTISKVYQEAIQSLKSKGSLVQSDVMYWEDELRKMNHRSYTTASLDSPADADSIYSSRMEEIGEYQVAAYVVDIIDETNEMIIDIRLKFDNKTELELLPFNGIPISFRPEYLKMLSGELVESCKPSTFIKVQKMEGAKPLMIIRQRNLQ